MNSIRAPKAIAAAFLLQLLGSLNTGPIAHAQSNADSLTGQRAQCADFRSGETFSIGVQHVLENGAISTQQLQSGAQMCVGTAREIASASISDGMGGALIVWVDTRSGEADLYAQRLTAQGAIAVGWPSDGIVLCAARGFQDRVALASDGAGGVIVAWQDYRSGPNGKIYSQRVTGDGVLAWTPDGVPVSADSSDQGAPAIALAPDGGAIVIWQDARGGDYDLRWAHLSSQGQVTTQQGGEALVTVAGDQRGARLISDSPGHFLAVWQSNDSQTTDLSALGFSVDALGAITSPGSPQRIARAVGIDPALALCAVNTGGAWVAWSQRDADQGDIRVQRLSASAVPSGADTGLAVCVEAHEQYAPAICGDGEGGCIVSWEDYRGSDADIYAQRVSSATTALWATGGVPICLAPGLQYEPGIRPDGSSGAVVSWSDAATTSRASLVRARPVLPGVLPQVTASEVGPGRAKITWRGNANDSTLYAVQRQVGADAWTVLGHVRVGPNGELAYEDRTVAPGAEASYRLAVESRSVLVGLEAVHLSIPLPMPLSIQFARMENNGRLVRIAYVLATHDAAKLELLDVAGRRVLVRDLRSEGAGVHEERFASSLLPSGVYFVRLHQSTQVRSARLILVR